jgi:hypothetical protein
VKIKINNLTPLGFEPTMIDVANLASSSSCSSQRCRVTRWFYHIQAIFCPKKP